MAVVLPPRRKGASTRIWRIRSSHPTTRSSSTHRHIALGTPPNAHDKQWSGFGNRPGASNNGNRYSDQRAVSVAKSRCAHTLTESDLTKATQFVSPIRPSIVANPSSRDKRNENGKKQAQSTDAVFLVIVSLAARAWL
jgi:hypothetical protein